MVNENYAYYYSIFRRHSHLAKSLLVLQLLNNYSLTTIYTINKLTKDSNSPETGKSHFKCSIQPIINLHAIVK